MMQNRMMTLDEKLDIAMQAHELRAAGKEEEARQVLFQIPMPPYLAKVFKEKVGVDYLLNGNFNLAEAEVEFGTDWLNR